IIVRNMKKLKAKRSTFGTRISSRFMILATEPSALADPLPQGKPKIVDGETLQGYDLAGYKSLVVLGAEVVSLRETTSALQAQVDHLEESVSLLESVRAAQDEKIHMYSEENQRLYDMWKEENRKRHEAEARPDWGSALAWGAAGTFAVSTAVLLL